MRRFLMGALAALVALTAFTVGTASAQQTKFEIFCISGQATTSGALNFKIIPRGSGCAAAAIFSHNQSYDAVVGGLPTTAAEVDSLAQLGLSAAAPAGYLVMRSGRQCIRVSGPSAFDVCVDGVAITEGGTYSENGLTIVGASKSKVPAASLSGLAALTALMIATAVLLRQRRPDVA